MKLNKDIHSIFKDKGAKEFPVIAAKGTEITIPEQSDHGEVLIVEVNGNRISVLKEHIEWD